MKKTLTLSLLLITSICFGQIQPYLDIGPTWELPMSGKVSVDAGLNLNHISIEANGMFVGYSRMGGTVGYQFGERGGEWARVRVYGGSFYGNFSESAKEDALLVPKWRSVIGMKVTHGSLAYDIRTITNFQTLKQTELYMTIGFQIISIYKWAFNKK